MAQQQQPCDLAALVRFKQELDKINEARKGVKANHDALEKAAVNAMLAANVRYVLEQASNPQAYWVLQKSKSEGTFKKERYIEFFGLLLRALRERPNLSAEQITQMALDYLNTFQKRSVTLNRVTQLRGAAADCNELRAWLSGVDAPEEQKHQ